MGSRWNIAAALAVAAALAGCSSPPITPDDVAHLQPGAHVRVHVWAPGGPGPGKVISGTYEGQDNDKIVLLRDGKRLEIYKAEIHDDTRDVK